VILKIFYFPRPFVHRAYWVRLITSKIQKIFPFSESSVIFKKKIELAQGFNSHSCLINISQYIFFRSLSSNYPWSEISSNNLSKILIFNIFKFDAIQQRWMTIEWWRVAYDSIKSSFTPWTFWDLPSDHKNWTHPSETLSSSLRLLRYETKRLGTFFEMLDSPLYKSYVKAP